ncbi:MAG: hypothetical protein J6D06_01575 [Clostridia bacterium]|nr:hypothetical protein [Clostridia bacterium]
MKIKFTEINSGYEGERKVSRFSPQTRSKAIIVGVLAAVFVFVYILSSVGVIPLGALLLKARVAVSGDDERFPIAVSTESVLNSDIMGENIVLLTTENVVVYSPNGKEAFSQPHVFAKPGISVNGDKAIVFDRAGKGFMLLNQKKVVYEGQADNTIISAEYGKNGSYALGTRSKSATSSLAVYNKNHKQIFQWNCAYESIVSITLSDNGKFAGVAVLGAENGELFTTVQYFGFDYKEPLNTQKIVGCAPFELEFTKYNLLTLVTDRGVYLIDKKEKEYKEIASYYSSEFNSSDVSVKKNFLVAVAKYGSQNVFEILIYKPDGTLKTTISADYQIRNVVMSEKYVFTLTEDKVTVYNLNGKEVSQISFKGEASGILPTDDFVFVESLDKISRAFSYGDSTIELS